MSVLNISNTQVDHQWFPKAITTVSIGTSAAAISAIALEVLPELIWKSKDEILFNAVWYGFGSISLAGTVIALTAIVKICHKILSENTDIKIALSMTAAGVLLTSLAEASWTHFSDIAPYFKDVLEEGGSIAHYTATNFAAHVSSLIILGALISTGYSAYCVVHSVLNKIENQAKA